MSGLKSFEDLACYQEARQFRKMVFSFCRTLPQEEKYRLKDQIIRSSRSVPSNIAEGYGRYHHQENLQFCRQARGSLTESLEHLNCALDDAYLTRQQYAELRAQLEQTWKVLNGYIAYIARCARDGVPSSPDTPAIQQPNNSTT